MRVHLMGTDCSIDVPLGEHVLGRSHDCSLRLDEPRLSRHHAKFHNQGDKVILEDLGSTNGILLNGQRLIGSTHIHNGDTIVCGPLVFTVLFDATQKASPSEFVPQTDRRPPVGSDTEAMVALKVPDTDLVASNKPRVRRLTPMNEMHSNTASGSSESLRPSEQTPLGTGALSNKQVKPARIPGAPLPAPANSDKKPKRKHTSVLFPNEFTPTSGSALQPDFPSGARLGHASQLNRLLGGFLDSLTVLMLTILLCTPIVLLGYAWSLGQFGVVIDHGLPQHTATPPATTPYTAIVASFLHPGGFERAGELLAAMADAKDQSALLTFFITTSFACLVMVIINLIYLVGATVLHGAPFYHRRVRLVIVDNATGHRLTWVRAVVRWVLFAMLWPLIPFTLASNKRGLHDILSGCAVRQRI